VPPLHSRETYIEQAKGLANKHGRGLGELQRVADMQGAGEKFRGVVILGETKGSCWRWNLYLSF